MKPPLAALRALIAAIQPGNRFQSPRVAGLSDLGSLDAFRDRVPFTTKAEIVADFAAHPPHGSNLTFPRERYTRFCQTSGTTAHPLAILDTAESWQWMLENWQVIYRAAGLARGMRMYFAFSFGPFLGFWTAFEAATQFGCLCIPGGGLASAARVRAILAHGAEVLCCTPTYALHLAEVAAREALPIGASAVRKIIVAGEPGGCSPTVRERISQAWGGAEIFDHYGMTEVGPVAYQQLGESDALRIMEDRYFAEVIDPQTRSPTPLGEVGELVLTPLGRTAWPLLRYRTGDLVRRVPDESGLAPAFRLAGGILGRADDMVVIRGVNIYPSAVEAVVRNLPEIGEYRATVTRRGEMAELALEIESSDATAAGRLERLFTQVFTLRIPVATVAAGTLPTFELKARRWVKA